MMGGVETPQVAQKCRQRVNPPSGPEGVPLSRPTVSLADLSRCPRPYASDGVLALAWGLVLAAVWFAPYLAGLATLGEDRTRFTIWLSLACYAVAAALMLRLRPAEWAATEGRGRLARWCWTFGWAAFLVHLGSAFHYYHHWSHADAVARTEAVSGFGPGVYCSYLFGLLWTADVAAWWLAPGWYVARSPWIDRLLHGYLAFVGFNATVVYGQGPIRWAGALLWTGLAAGWLYRRRHLWNPARPAAA